MPKPRILVVDDEPDILLALRDMFEGMLGCQVVVTTMPHVALMALGTKPGFDLVVADYRMPGMDGISFLVQAKEKHPTTPRIFMTAFMDPALQADAVARGGAALCLTKPLDADQLLDGVRRLLGPAANKAAPASPGKAAPAGKTAPAGPAKTAGRQLGRIPTFGAAQRPTGEAEEELLIATCTSCRAQVVVEPGQFVQDGSGWVARPCFVTPACIGKLQP